MVGARVIAEHVSRSYGQAAVLDDVSFVVEPGELVAVSGPSGAGKTTLLKLLFRAERPTDGPVRNTNSPLDIWNVTSRRTRLPRNSFWTW